MLWARGFAVRKSAIAGAACLIAFLGTAPSSAVAWGPYNHLDPTFCDTATVRGNPKELKKLPELRHAPASEQLPFTPETMRFRPYSEFQVGEGTVGFLLSQRDGHRTESLDLSIVATFMRIDRHGRTIATLGQEKTHLSSLKGYETVPLSHDVAKPGFYRASISFKDRSGKPLGQYGTYFRLLPLVVRSPRLALNARTFTPDERVLARVENFSRDSISYGVPYRIQRWDGATWTKAPESPRLFIMPLYRSGPGSTGPCLPFHIPETMEPGLYRMVKPIRFESLLFARFEIIPAP